MSFDRELRVIVVSPRQRKAAELRSKGELWLFTGLLAMIALATGLLLVSDVTALAPLGIAWFVSLTTGLQYHVRSVHHEGLADQERRDHLDALKGMS